MRDEQTVLNELVKAREDYHKVADSLPAAKLAVRSSAIKALMRELSDVIANGASVCPLCGKRPHGRQKTPAYSDSHGQHEAVYEVVCLNCRPKFELVVNHPELAKKIEMRAQGTGSPASAVLAWNAKQFIIATVSSKSLTA